MLGDKLSTLTRTQFLPSSRYIYPQQALLNNAIMHNTGKSLFLENAKCDMHVTMIATEHHGSSLKASWTGALWLSATRTPLFGMLAL